ncbi:MAG: SDR family NAD(P)-dependent oxidoreductase, partial [Deltaproteobacteria bacterium]|nr:SDR family NAD(P)-dependent oxidoreductase [Deltaproteobacteria bacterium]
MGALEGRVAIVTGASGGIGKSICKVLATEGADIVA